MINYWTNSKFYSLVFKRNNIFNYDNAVKVGLTFIVLILSIFRLQALPFNHDSYPNFIALPSKIASFNTVKNNQTCNHSVLTYFKRSSCKTASYKGIWEELAHHFSLNHQTHNPAVRKQLNWIIKHPDYIHTLTKQSKPYLYHLYNEIKKRNLPGELALIPMIESEYDPFSSSSKGAAGIWQLMPQTARELGLIRNWWVDARKNFTPATNAAFNYLSYLHHFFHGDWILAVAAYNSGEGTVKKAMRRGHQQYFWNLRLPQETKRYIPKLLALAEVVQNPKQYHIQLPVLPNKPELEEVEIKNHISLQSAAQLATIPKQQLFKLNPGFKNWSTHPTQPYKILMPSKYIQTFYNNLTAYSKTKLVSLETTYQSRTTKNRSKKKSVHSRSHYKIHTHR